MRLQRKFFELNTVTVARELLGKILCRKIGDKVVRVKITETEAYCGQDDLASHASRGMTPRTKLMFGRPGHAYIYMIYGMYYCLNFVTDKKGYPAAVLIRGCKLIPKNDFKFKILNPNLPLKKYLQGPGRLCRELKINKSLNGIDIVNSKELWVEDSKKPVNQKIKKRKRIGVDYAGKWKNKLWRFYIEV
jgi:DNA-3-methyladenine glycosylase